jgi:hypothetical protein
VGCLFVSCGMFICFLWDVYLFHVGCLFVSCGMFICFMWDVYLFHVGCLFVSCGVKVPPSTMKNNKKYSGNDLIRGVSIGLSGK